MTKREKELEEILEKVRLDLVYARYHANKRAVEINRLKKLAANNRKLRRLVASAIYLRDCLWCDAPYVSDSKKHAYHGDLCPAFTPEGNVK